MNRIITYYGDDFTGSTDTMEALATHGVDTVLFTRLPTPAEFQPYSGNAAIGLAGTSRSRAPEWMDEHLPPAFAWLRSLGARFCHYKVCSTFDSAPHVGNIGRATEIGCRVFNQAMVPLIVGAPQLRRFTFAGNLFAAFQGEVFRIDRHPVMSRHPVTPMAEADLRLHLEKQTERKTVLAGAEFPADGNALVDVFDETSQLQAGRRLLAWTGGFLVGSSGVEYALVKALAEARDITGKAEFQPLAPVPQVIVVSGSVSPTTERQIRHALAEGFVAVPVDAVALAQGDAGEEARAVDAALRVLSSRGSPLVHTALGPGTDEGPKIDAVPEGRKRIGETLGRILKRLMEASGLRRVIIAGGDSSSHALSQLDIYALTTRMPLPATPGSPLCLARSGSAALDGIEIALKGGQLGGDQYFVQLRQGKAS